MRCWSRLVAELAPQLIAVAGIGPETAGQLLVTAGDNPERLGSEASFAHPCGVAPIPACSGRTQRHRLNRGGDRAANSALPHRGDHPTPLRTHGPAPTFNPRRATEGLSKPEISSDASNEPSPASSTPPDRLSHPGRCSITAKSSRRRGQGGAPNRRNDLDRAEHQHTIKDGGTGTLTNREAS